VRAVQSSQHIQTEIQYPIYLLIKFIIESKINSGFKKIACVLMGKKDSTTKPFQSSKFFGLGKNYTLDLWKHISNICVFNDLLEEHTIPSGFGTVIKFTSKALEYHKKIKQVVLIHKIKSDDYDRVVFVLDEIKEEYSIPRDSLDDLNSLIKKRTITGVEEILEENNLI
jgi:superfamily II DNA helicase RecQ